MSDLIEYHGWVVLYCRDENWSDEEWDAARNDVEFAVGQLREEDGHSAHFSWPADGGFVVALNGWAESPEPALSILRLIAKVAANSYGELAAFPTAEPDSKTIVRYELREGVVKKVG